MDIAKKIDELSNKINFYNEQYYQFNQSEISDEEFDKLLQELIELETNYPLFAKPDSPTQRVGGKINKEFETVVHQYRMLSLSNTYNDEDLYEFDQRVNKGLDGGSYEYVCELKFDGVALSFWYENGVLQRGVTRGDGTRGDDITDNVKTIKDLPLSVRGNKFPASFEVRGEGYMPLESFERINLEKQAKGEPLMANPRNAASGTFKMQNSAEVAKRNMAVYIYSYLSKGQEFNSHSESLQYLEKEGFPLSPTWKICKTIHEVKEYIEYWRERRNDLPLNTDGIVIKINDFKQQEILGFTAKSPRWAIAFKYPSEVAKTKILGISYQVGRTGNITPVANLQPVYLAGTMVKRASIHNYNEMQRLGLHRGDVVLVEKGGEIIPKITGVDLNQRQENTSMYEFPEFCPECNSPLIRLEGEANHYCLNDNGCPPQIKGKIEHFVSRKAMDIDSMGSETIELLYEKNLVRNIADIYHLRAEDLYGLEGWKEKSIQNLLNGIQESKKMPYKKVLFGLGIRHVGETIAQKLSDVFPSIDSLAAASLEEIISVHEIGERIAQSIKAYFSVDNNRIIIERLKNSGLNFFEEKKEIVLEGNQLVGKSFVISGVFENFERDELKATILSHGGKVVSSISGKLDYLVAGNNMGPSKLEKAEKLGIKIIDEEAFLELIK